MAKRRKKAADNDAAFNGTASPKVRDGRISLLTIITLSLLLFSGGGALWLRMQAEAVAALMAAANPVHWSARPGFEAEFAAMQAAAMAGEGMPVETAPAPIAPVPEPVVEPEPEPQAVVEAPPVETAAQKNDKLEQPLLPAPADGLTEAVQGLAGVPRVAVDGRQPWQAYARPFEQTDQRPRLSVLLVEMGLSQEMTKGAIDHLHPAIGLALIPYAPAVGDLARAARLAGHEVLVAMPMQPLDFPRNDAGPGSLLNAVAPKDNITRLHQALVAVPGAVGIMPFMGQAFLSQQAFYLPVLQELKLRGLLYHDPRTMQGDGVATSVKTLQGPLTVGTRWLDVTPSRDGIQAALAQFEDEARSKGSALAMARPFPVVLQALKDWAPTVAGKGFALAPLTAMANLHMN